MPEKVYVVCDASGTCQGVFVDESLAHQIAKDIGAYVSRHPIITEYDMYWYQKYTKQVIGEE